MTTAAQAARHYLSRGRGEGRLYKRVRLLLRYTACSGLINQQYSHIAAFALAAALGAEIVLPPAVCRDSFAHYFRCVSVSGCVCVVGAWGGWGAWGPKMPPAVCSMQASAYSCRTRTHAALDSDVLWPLGFRV